MDFLRYDMYQFIWGEKLLRKLTVVYWLSSWTITLEVRSSIGRRVGAVFFLLQILYWRLGWFSGSRSTTNSQTFRIPFPHLRRHWFDSRYLEIHIHIILIGSMIIWYQSKGCSLFYFFAVGLFFIIIYCLYFFFLVFGYLFSFFLLWHTYIFPKWLNLGRKT